MDTSTIHTQGRSMEAAQAHVAIEFAPPEWVIDTPAKLHELTDPYFTPSNSEQPPPALPTSVLIKSTFADNNTDGIRTVTENLKAAGISFPSIYLEVNQSKLEKMALREDSPPLPNPSLHLPPGLNFELLCGKETPNGGYEAAEQSLSEKAYTHEWYNKSIPAADQIAYDTTYGVKTKISLARKHLINQETTNQNPENGHRRYVCYGTGRIYDHNRLLDADHLFPKKGPISIHSRIMSLFNKINTDEQCRKNIFEIIGCFKKRWVTQISDTYLPTKHLMRDYFNDIDNLALTNSADNQMKSSNDSETYLKGLLLYNKLLKENVICKQYFIDCFKQQNTFVGLGKAMFCFLHAHHSEYLKLTINEFEITKVLADKSLALLKLKNRCEDLKEKTNEFHTQQLVGLALNEYEDLKVEFDKWKTNAETHRELILEFVSLDSKRNSFSTVNFTPEEDLANAILNSR